MKKILKICGGVFLFTVVSGIIAGYLGYGPLSGDYSKNTTDRTYIPEEPKTVSGELASFLPTREDLSTEWKIGGCPALNSGADKWSDENTKGYISQDGLTLCKEATVFIQLFKFDFEENAQLFMDDELTPIKQTGGYKEINVSNYGSKCYGTKVTGTFIGDSTIRCVEKNIYVRIIGTSFLYDDPEDNLRTIADIVIPKIK